MKQYVLILSSFVLLLGCGNEEKENKGAPVHLDTLTMPIDHGVVSEEERERREMAADTTPKSNPYKNAKIDVKVIDNSKSKDVPKVDGYGYDIFLFDAMYVHQPHIPAINGNRGFHTKAQAQKAGDFVAYKIRNNIMPPSISVQELDSLGVLK